MQTSDHQDQNDNENKLEEVALLEQPSSSISESEAPRHEPNGTLNGNPRVSSLDLNQVTDGRPWKGLANHLNTGREGQFEPSEVQPLRNAQRQAFAVESPVDGKAVLRKVDRHMLPFYFSLSLLCSIDRANLSYAALQLNDDLHFTQTVYGLGSGMFFLGYMVFQVPSTYVCARVGAPVFLGSILITWGLVATLFAWMKTSTHFYILRFILGLAESGAYPGMWYSLALFYNDKELGVAYTSVAMATALAGVVGGPIAACLLLLDGVGDLRGWQWLFLLEGLPAVLLGTAMCFFLARCPASARFLAQEERDWLLLRKSQSAPRALSSGLDGTPGADKEEKFYRSWRIWYLGGVWLLVAAGLDGIVFWGPILIHRILDNDSLPGAKGAADVTEDLQDTGLQVWPVVQAALLSSIPFGFASVCMLVNAHLAKRADERNWHGALSAFVAALAFAVLPAVMGRVEWASFACLSFAAAGVWSVHGPLLSWPAAVLSGTNAAAGFALVKMMGGAGSFIGPSIIGALTDASGGSFTPAMLVLSACSLVAALMNLLFWPQGGRRSFLPDFPYGRAHLFKRSRSDIGVVEPSPFLRRILSGRQSGYLSWQPPEPTGRTAGHQENSSHVQHPGGQVQLGEVLWERHTGLPKV